MSALFTTVFNMSITATYIALGAMVIRLVLTKLPKIFSYALWSAVLIRLICPVSFTSSFSFFSFIRPTEQGNSAILEYLPYNIGLMQNPGVDMGINSISNSVNNFLPAATPIASANPMQIYMPMISIWLIGIFVILLQCILISQSDQQCENSYFSPRQHF